jgi:hypothetical protein
MLPLNVNHALSKKRLLWVKKSIGYQFLKPILSFQSGGNNVYSFNFVWVWFSKFCCCVNWSFHHFALKSQQAQGFVALKHHSNPPSLQLQHDISVFLSGRTECCSELSTVLHVILLHGSICAGHSLQNVQQLFFFPCCILRKVLQIDSFFNWICSTCSLKSSSWAITVTCHLLLGSDCSIYNTVTLSTSVHTVV